MMWDTQGYPQRMRLQRRFYEIVLVLFLAVRVHCRPKWLISAINHYINLQNTQLIAKTENRHIFIVLGSLQSHPFWVTLYLELEIHT